MVNTGTAAVLRLSESVQGDVSARTRHEPWFSAHPVRCAEVDRLCKVVALVEATVIGPGEGHHKLACALIGPVHLKEKIATPTNVNDHLKTKRAIGTVTTEGRIVQWPLG